MIRRVASDSFSGAASMVRSHLSRIMQALQRRRSTELHSRFSVESCAAIQLPFHSLPWFLANKRRKLVRTPVNINESATIPFGNPAMKKNIWRAVIEVGFIIFLFYSNLLMGEFERSGMGQKRGLVWAIGDVLTNANFEIATIAALIGYILVEFLRKRF
jgi:hypothetical protein